MIKGSEKSGVKHGSSRFTEKHQTNLLSDGEAIQQGVIFMIFKLLLQENLNNIQYSFY